MIFTEETAEKLGEFIENREGSNYSDSLGFAYEILDFLEEKGEME